MLNHYIKWNLRKDDVDFSWPSWLLSTEVWTLLTIPPILCWIFSSLFMNMHIPFTWNFPILLLEKTLLWARCFPYLLQVINSLFSKLFGLVVSFGLRATKRETRFDVTGFTHWHSLVSLKRLLIFDFLFLFPSSGNFFFFLLNLLVQIPKRGYLAGSANKWCHSHWWRICWRLIVRLGAMFWKHLAGTSPVRGMVLDKD